MKKDHDFVLNLRKKTMSMPFGKVAVVNYVSNSGVLEFVEKIFGDQMHAKRVGSLADAAIGLLHSEELLLHKMGEGLAGAKLLDKKHATKQIDRLLSNKKLDIWDNAAPWVGYLIGERKEIMVSLDWTDFDADQQSTLALNLITDHGRASPLLWKTVYKSSLKHNRARYEDQLLSRLKELLSAETHVILLADRGFADKLFFNFIENTLEFDYIIRIRGSIYITDKNGESKLAKAWLKENGHTSTLENVSVTQANQPVAKFVSTQQKAMKDAWYLVSSCKELAGSKIVEYYGKRWKIEPYFRDIKDQRFGFGLEATHISKPDRRDRLFFISSICIALLTVLGAAGESIGFDRKLKVNTVKTRTHSLLRQGIFYYKFLVNFKQEEQQRLLTAFNHLLEQQPMWGKLFFVL